MEVEGVVAGTPCHRALLCWAALLIRLALDAEIHDVVSANSARIHLNIPRP